MSKKLFYSSADADTLAASDFTGAHLYASDVKLTRTTVGAKEALDVFVANNIGIDVDGIYDAGTNLDPDNVGMIAHTRSATPTDVEQVERTTAGIADSDNVVAADVHGLDVMAFGMVFDGTTWDRLRGTGGAVNIHDGGGSITVDGTVAVTQSTSPWVVSDAALANTAILATAATVTTTSAALLAGALANRKYLFLYNNGNKVVDIGPSGVASGAGFPIFPGVYFEMRLGAAVALHADAAGGSQDVRVLEAS